MPFIFFRADGKPVPAPQALSTLRGYSSGVIDILKAYNAERQRIASSTAYVTALTSEGLQEGKRLQREALQNAQADVVAKLEEHRAKVTSEAVQVRQHLAALMGRPDPKDTNEALLRESRESRAWNRIRNILENREEEKLTAEVKGIVETALADGDEDTIGALRQEIGAYSRGRGSGSARLVSVLDSTLAKARPEIAETIAVRSEVETGTKNIQDAIDNAKAKVRTNADSLYVTGWKADDIKYFSFDPVRLG